MKNSRLKIQLHSKGLIIGCFVVSVAVILLLLPWLNTRRHNFINNQIQQASEQASKGDYQTAIGILARTSWLSFGGKDIPLALGNTYEVIGDYHNAVRAYQQAPFADSYNQIGEAALIQQDFALANATYAKAVKLWPTSGNYVSLAVAQFNQNKIQEGCQSATNAAKAQLTSERAQAMQASCLILQDQAANAASQYPQFTAQFASSPRHTAYFLLQQGIVTKGEQILTQLDNKSAQDWYILAQIAAQKGDKNEAMSRAQSGLKVDPTYVPLNRFLQVLNSQQGNSAQAALYEHRLQDLSSTE